MATNKQELLQEAVRLSKEHSDKKQMISTILEDLDKEKKISDKHISGMAVVNEILKEMEVLEIQHAEILEKIKIK